MTRLALALLLACGPRPTAEREVYCTGGAHAIVSRGKVVGCQR